MQEHRTSHRIREIRIIGGFLDGVVYKFSEKLNCIIGQRGTGKTTIIEFIRYCLDAMPPNPVAKKNIENLVATNLNGGRIEVTIETAGGIVYIISRSAGEPPRVFDSNHQSTGLAFSPNIFRVDIFSQNEVEEIAGQNTYQMALLESLSHGELVPIHANIEKAQQALNNNAAEIMPLKKRERELQEALALLPSVQKKMESLVAENGEDAESINRAHQQKNFRTLETHYAEHLKNIYANTAKALHELENSIGTQLSFNLPQNMEKSDDYPIIDAMRSILSTANDDLNHAVQAALANLQDSYHRFQARRKELDILQQKADMDFRLLIEKCKAEQVRSSERRKVEDEYTRLIAAQGELAEVQRLIAKLRETRTSLMSQLYNWRDKRFFARQRIVDGVNKALLPSIRVSLIQFGCVDKYAEMLVSFLRDSNIMYKKISPIVASKISPNTLIKLVQKQDLPGLIAAANLTENQAKAILTLLNRDDYIAQLETVELLDCTTIELDDHGTYKTTDTLSTGQKCNTILPILLLDSDRPLLIDQPEDNLDNRFVHTTIVKSVNRVKQHRQLVFVTHNPNIPVLSDAERMLVMGSNGVSGEIRQMGTVDECKDLIVELLEGGEDAFRKRKERYAY